MAITVGDIANARSEKKYGFKFDAKKVALVYFPPSDKHDNYSFKGSIESRFNTHLRDGLPYDYWGKRPQVDVVSVDELAARYHEYDALALKTSGAIMQKEYKWVCELDMPVYYWETPGINGLVKTVSEVGKYEINRYGCFRRIVKGSIAQYDDCIILPLEPVFKPTK